MCVWEGDAALADVDTEVRVCAGFGVVYACLWVCWLFGWDGSEEGEWGFVH